VVFKERLAFDDLPAEIGRLIDRWRAERAADEAFGDWCHRLGVEALKN
jgi:sulfite reductase beta subunit-like hemoprotein